MTALEWALGTGWACALGAAAALALVRAQVQSRMALVAEASHELRGPLTAVQLGLAALVRDAEPERARHAAALDLELRRAGLALEDLAAAPEGRRAPDALGVVDVGDLLEDAYAAWEGVAAAYRTSLSVEPMEDWWVVRADRVRLAQALGNLIANALEHGRGEVRLRARPVAGHGLRLEVLDGGPGLSAPLAASGPHAGRRGHGLGVAARVAERCGGRLVSETTSEGHAMALELPLPGAPAR